MNAETNVPLLLSARQISHIFRRSVKHSYRCYSAAPNVIKCTHVKDKSLAYQNL
jgi:hypothetical protein